MLRRNEQAISNLINNDEVASIQESDNEQEIDKLKQRRNFLQRLQVKEKLEGETWGMDKFEELQAIESRLSTITGEGPLTEAEKKELNDLYLLQTKGDTPLSEEQVERRNALEARLERFK